MSRVQDGVYTLSQVSLQPPASFPELYQELWWYSGSSTTENSANTWFVQKGSTSATISQSSSAIKLLTLSSSWPVGTKFAFEATIWGSTTSNASAVLIDTSASMLTISGSSISTTSTTATVVRSGQFTLTPGHQFAIQISNSVGTSTTYITDASLIIFPPAGSVSPSLSSISLANPSGGSLKEAYIPLWVMSSGTCTSVATSAGASASMLRKGNVNAGNSSTSDCKLHTLNSAWSTGQKFALEMSLSVQSSSSYTAYAALWDFTAGAIVSGSQISTNSTTATLIRSGSVSLVPGRIYGVTAWSSSASYGSVTSKAHLVALGS